MWHPTGNGKYMLTRTIYNDYETNHLTADEPLYSLVNTENGSRKVVSKGLPSELRLLSPEEKYVFWENLHTNSCFAYNILTGITKDITPTANKDLGKFNFSKWAENDEFAYIYDDFDIWRVDPKGEKPSVNITNSYGRKNNIVLRFVRESLESPHIKSNKTVFLCGFNKSNKNNCFFQKDVSSTADPVVLSTQPEHLHFSDNFVFVTFPNFLVKAKNADVFLLMGMSSMRCENIKVTKDFIKFDDMSDLAPQSKNNWLTAELITWKTSDNKIGNGILYKPEDFDPKKRYPVIFFIYENITDGINIFPSIELSEGNLNVSFFC